MNNRFDCKEVWGDMDKIDELQAKIERLELEKRIAELELQIARLDAEIAALKNRPTWVWYPYYPNPWAVQPWSVPTITWSSDTYTTAANTSELTA